MKIKVAGFVEEAKPIFLFSIALWVAANWVLSNSTVQEELVRRAYAGAGVPQTDPLHHEKLVVKGAPEWAYQVRIHRGDWKEKI